MPEAFRVSVLVAFQIRREVSLGGDGLLDQTRAFWDFVGEELHGPIRRDPIVAQGTGPVVPVPPPPLRSEVPSQRDGPAPQRPEQEGRSAGLKLQIAEV